MSDFLIRSLTTADELRAAWPVVQQLRPHLDQERFVAQALRQMAEGYRATALYDDGVPRAYAGWRVHEFLVYGQTAVSTSRVTVKGRHKGQDIGGTYRVSTTLVKKSGRWQIIALVTSPAAASPPPAS